VWLKQVLFLKDLVGVGFERKTPIRDVLSAFDGHKRVHYVAENEELGKVWPRPV
jgi:hypothetical protein